MTYPDSMFLLEIEVQDLKSFIDCKEFHIKSKFADVFKLNLKDPNNSEPSKPSTPTKRRPKKKIKVRDDNTLDHKPTIEGKLQSGQSILFTIPITTLITNMKNYPIEITFYNKDDRCKKIGSVHVPWSPLYIDYLYLLATKVPAAPIVANGAHNVYNELTSRRIASITLKIKLTHLRDKLTSLNRSLAVSKPKPKVRHHVMCNSKPLATTLSNPIGTAIDNPGTIKTIYSGENKKKNLNKSKAKQFEELNVVDEDVIIKTNEFSNNVNVAASTAQIPSESIKTEIKQIKLSNLYCVKSEYDLKRRLRDDIARTKSCSFMDRKHFNFLNYVFDNSDKPLPGRVLCVSYFTVENEFKDGSSSKPSSSKGSLQGSSSKGSPSRGSPSKGSPSKGSTSKSSAKGSDTSDCDCPDKTGLLKVCHKDCTKRKDDDTCSSKGCEKYANRISLKQCDKVRCNILEKRKLPPPPDETIHLDLRSLKKNRLDELSQAVEKVVGGMKAKMKYDEKTCFCECECTFGFVKRTTYCTVCGGFEKPGEDMSRKNLTAPFPCPIYHKINDKNKQKSTSGSDRSKLGDSKSLIKKGNKLSGSGKSSPAPNPVSIESDKEYCRKRKKENKDDRFKFNYGYTAPQIGHSRCVMPCTGTLNAVPKSMGWLWTADDVPGMRFRPSWRPGCVHKHVLHLLRMAKDPGIVLSKKKKKPEKKKKPLKRPLLTVSKKDGEYTVTMETMKAYSKPRALNQQPYEDKPVLTYTIGRTEEENRERKKRKEREHRRLQRDQRAFIQSAFTDMCKEICLKTYQQALGFLPDTETPDCACYPNNPGAEDTNLDRSCSCSEDEVSFGSDTDSDEWIVEFTPPNAHFDPTYKGKKVAKQDNETQYSYLDYRVKLLDRNGNQVVRFFKGPDGKQQCSDLGGFWGPDHNWLEINMDGFIGPDDRWAPMIFIGPHGDHVDCETGKFQDVDGTWLTVGVDGYVDSTGKWKFYPKSIHAPSPQKKTLRKGIGEKRDNTVAANKPSETWSCFGDANPQELSKLGILGHGRDKKLLLQRLREMLKQGKDVKIPELSVVPRVPASKRGKRKDEDIFESSFYSERSKCKHAVPSDKGIVAVDSFGNKTYFKIKSYNNKKRSAKRIANLAHQGISTSSFHIPCFSSFINAEMMKKQQYEKFLKNQASKSEDMEYGTSTYSKDVSTQAQYRYRYAI